VSTSSTTERRHEVSAEAVARRRGLPGLARGGLVTRGVVYGLVGFLSLELALGVGGKTTSQQGALRTIAHQPLGEVLLVVIAVGLGAYAVWRLFSGAFGGRDQQEHEMVRRIGALASGLVYAGLCATAVAIVVGSGRSSTSGSPAAKRPGFSDGPEER
jgi:hypothetical protein